jgi:predicted site-specific integrase-resolvase
LSTTALLRQSDFARRVGVAEVTVRRWVRREETVPGTGVRFVRLPTGERRIPESEVEHIIGAQ